MSTSYPAQRLQISVPHFKEPKIINWEKTCAKFWKLDVNIRWGNSFFREADKQDIMKHILVVRERVMKDEPLPEWAPFLVKIFYSTVLKGKEIIYFPVWWVRQIRLIAIAEDATTVLCLIPNLDTSIDLLPNKAAVRDRMVKQYGKGALNELLASSKRKNRKRITLPTKDDTDINKPEDYKDERK